jgi:hypothetical protein
MEVASDRSRDRGASKKIRLIYSEPTLAHAVVGEELQMSCIVDKQQEDITVINSSDKVSQEESLS